MDAYSYNHINDVIQDLYEEGKLGEEEFDLLCECTDKADRYDRYKWHDLRKDPDDLPKTCGFGSVPCLIVREHSHTPEYAEYEFFEGYGWGFFGVDFGTIKAWREIEPFNDLPIEEK